MNGMAERLVTATVLARVLSSLAIMLVSATAHAGGPVDPARGIKRFALIIGSNATLDANQAALRFADDDAARVAELLSENGVHVELLSSFDTESQARFANLVVHTKPPRRQELELAMTRIAALTTSANANGHGTEFLFYYSGHGDVGGDGRSYLTLEDGPLTRHDLFTGILTRSGARTNHVVLDACRSEEFVLARGDWKDDRIRTAQTRAVESYLEERQLGHFPNTGVILASSADQQTHEWERYRGGIFTHELLSGLRGAADINGDGAIEYSELGAFVSAANRGVADPRARLAVTVRPPAANQRAPLLVYDAPARGRVLYFQGRSGFRYQIEDARGVRLADLRRSPGRPSYVRVPEGTLFVQRGDRGESEAQIAANSSGRVDVEALAFVESGRAARGALDEAFRHGLFEVPFGEGYYAGYTESSSLLAVAEPDWKIGVWGRDEKGELVELVHAEGSESANEEHAVVIHDCEQECDDDDDEDDDSAPFWGSLSLGLEFSPYNPEGEIVGLPKRVIGNEFRGFGADGMGRPLRGLDFRWWGFDAHSASDRPGVDGYFRSGYTQGTANFVPSSSGGVPRSDAAERLEYFTIPLFFAGNIYAFDSFPVRPFVGAGVGFDILALNYTRIDGRTKNDVSARLGFELHAGLDVRVNNWFSLVGEVRQLWSLRREINGLPDYSNEGLTLVTSLRVGFPLAPGRGSEHHVRPAHVHGRVQRGAPMGLPSPAGPRIAPPLPSPPLPAPPQPAPPEAAPPQPAPPPATPAPAPPQAPSPALPPVLAPPTDA